MGKQTPIRHSFTVAGKTITLETGKLAALADGAVWLQHEDTMMLATVCAERDPKPVDFFPLSVEYREKFAAAGRIPGNFFRREGRTSDYEILICRLIDRAIRPLFPENFQCETQVLLTLYSGNKNTPPDAYAALAASAALTISDIPFLGPISEVRVARINGEFIINPTETELKDADLNLIVGGTATEVTMVEGDAKECSEEDMVAAIKIGHQAVQEQIQGILAFRDLVGVPTKRELPPIPQDTELEARIRELAYQPLYDIAKSGLDKKERKAQFKVVQEQMVATLKTEYGEESYPEKAAMVKRYFGDLQYYTIREVALNEGIRLDGRGLTDIRPIWCEVDSLPAAHGSAIFTRGETQSLTSVTLGSKLDELMVDNALDLHFEKFLLHYNFPPFSTGEVKPMRGPGRREVGHGNLAGRSLKQVMPAGYPYTVRIVSDILESNGSSSMATVCAGALALMDAGVPITAPISGIAMGLITDDKGRVAILSDILGDEDALGDMDFKVTGTEKGITGCQMDIKIEGMPFELLERALAQAKEGRLHILSKMAEVLPESREDLKPHAPRMETLIVDGGFIGAIIGPGGKIIQGIQKETGTVVTIEEVGDNGVVTISSNNGDSLRRAMDIIKGIASRPEVGDIYDAKVVTIMPYGAFVEFLPGKQGLLHISEVSYTRIDNMEEAFAEGEMVKVKLLEIDPKTGKYRLSRKALLEKPEGYVERPREERPRDDSRGPRDDRNGRGGGGGRGGFGGGGRR